MAIVEIRKKEFIPEKDERGRLLMTEEYLKNICENSQGYSTPYLNDTLYLHFKGFNEIGGLQKYKNVKCIFLENNAISEI